MYVGYLRSKGFDGNIADFLVKAYTKCQKLYPYHLKTILMDLNRNEFYIDHLNFRMKCRIEYILIYDMYY